jgi:Tfp pilus assembly protein PilN
MIRINLLPVRETKKKKFRKEFLILGTFLLALELVVLYSWGASLDDQFIQVAARNKTLQQQVDGLKEAKAQIEERQKNKALLEAQNFIFDQLRYDKIGPSNLLLYFAYVLTRPEATEQNREELKKQEMVGWNIDWDADSVWVTGMADKDGTMEIEGEARAHEDVAELLKRLETGVFFFKPELVSQEAKFNPILEVHYIEFKIVADLNYNLDGYPKEIFGAAGPAR